VQGLERALGLLRRACSVAGANSILEELGFSGPSLPLDRKARAMLGLPDSIRVVEITLGTDCLRGLILELDKASALRDTLGTTAKALSTSAPQFLWIVCAFQPAAAEFAIACWTSARSRVRVVSLVCRTDKLMRVTPRPFAHSPRSLANRTSLLIPVGSMFSAANRSRKDSSPLFKALSLSSPFP